MEAVTADVFSAHQASVRADLPVAPVLLVGQENPAMLWSKGFSGRTFLRGQSGSGKTYALGVILERLLLHTGLRIVVVDPTRTTCASASSTLCPGPRDGPGPVGVRHGR